MMMVIGGQHIGMTRMDRRVMGLDEIWLGAISIVPQSQGFLHMQFR